VLLEELLMEENRISKIENLSTLVHLKKIDLGKNKIQRIEGLDALSSLVQLSLEDNEIETLSGVSKVSTLLELYLGNNKVSDMREVLQLRTLPKLIILDLSGNEVCARGEYRLYSIFHLKKLKVLDGLGVESSEQAAANDMYSGRLTEEFVVEKLGHKFFDHVSELDLSSNKIRDTANCITGESFGNLRVLNLDNNMISDLSGLTGLSVLAVLRLNHNRIESLGPEKPPHGLS
jgi:Leucine-rich repeat (LRR) protein